MCRHGLTIFELLIVLGIISMAMAMAWPALEEMFLGRRLTDAGTMLRNTLRDARRQALDDSITYRLDYSPSTSFCRIVPADDPFEEEASLETADPASTDKKTFEPTREEIELPDGIRVLGQEEFDQGPARGDEAGDPSDTTRSTTKNASPEESSSREWVPLVAMDHRLLELKVEPLTGEVIIGEIDHWLSDEDRRAEEEAHSLGLEKQVSSP
jgi:type II secretory pathway pseudopilin PulG